MNPSGERGTSDIKDFMQQSPHGPQTPLAELLSPDEITAVRRRIEDMFRQDYLRFGYPLMG